MDPGNEHMVNWLWGFTTVGINVDKVKAALGDLPMPDNAWDLLFKPEYVSKLKSCGVSFLDSATEVVPAALHYLGKPSSARTRATTPRPPSLLKAVRPHITLFSSSGYINDMANGSICVALGWSGDINIARQRAIDGKTGHNIEALIPKTGGLLFFDVMVIPADARARATRTSSSTTSCVPRCMPALTNKVFYANPNLESKKFVKPEVANNPTVFLSPADMARMVPPDALNNDLRRLMTRTFTSFKTGL
jgi:putrescine transport system substrate-binding protein